MSSRTCVLFFRFDNPTQFTHGFPDPSLTIHLIILDDLLGCSDVLTDFWVRLFGHWMFLE
jgi:hypothetical protein